MRTTLLFAASLLFVCAAIANGPVSAQSEQKWTAEDFTGLKDALAAAKNVRASSLGENALVAIDDGKAIRYWTASAAGARPLKWADGKDFTAQDVTVHQQGKIAYCELSRGESAPNEGFCIENGVAYSVTKPDGKPVSDVRVQFVTAAGVTLAWATHEKEKRLFALEGRKAKPIVDSEGNELVVSGWFLSNSADGGIYARYNPIDGSPQKVEWLQGDRVKPLDLPAMPEEYSGEQWRTDYMHFKDRVLVTTLDMTTAHGAAWLDVGGKAQKLVDSSGNPISHRGYDTFCSEGKVYLQASDFDDEGTQFTTTLYRVDPDKCVKLKLPKEPALELYVRVTLANHTMLCTIGRGKPAWLFSIIGDEVVPIREPDGAAVVGTPVAVSERHGENTLVKYSVGGKPRWGALKGSTMSPLLATGEDELAPHPVAIAGSTLFRIWQADGVGHVGPCVPGKVAADLHDKSKAVVQGADLSAAGAGDCLLVAFQDAKAKKWRLLIAKKKG
ncbi:MAG: hypothetical protein IT462_00225 [Planctomycetes bacterium]|nr:hypothetical protein [Planctomycetota bacterium]